jgi:hypothetical protein
MVDHTAAVALIEPLTVVGDPISMPDRMAERDIEAVYRPAIAIDQLSNLLAISQRSQDF